MLERKAAADKILLLGVDGLDPSLTRKYVDKGIMPNVKKYIERGACRQDLVLLGGHPTITPPMWTTLACGCNSNVHGITDFFGRGSDIHQARYNLDSRHCKAEPLWNCFAEAGKKTLVFHWPGSSWPPTSDSENLFVIDGTSPGSVGMATSQIESECILGASTAFKKTTFIPKAPMEASAACVITDLDLEEEKESAALSDDFTATSSNSHKAIAWKPEQHTVMASEAYIDMAQSTIREAKGWANAPVDAKEFYVLYSEGFIRRPALILKNETGIYDRVAIYKNKKAMEPMVVLALGKAIHGVVDDAMWEDNVVPVARTLKLLRLAEDGSSLSLYVSYGMDINNDLIWHPKRIFQDVKENVGTLASFSFMGRQDDMLISECMLDAWYGAIDYQAAAILYLVENEKLDVVFSHMHNVDMEEHQFIKHLADRPFNRNDVSMAEKWMRNLYIQTDYYIGKFVHLLDEGWTIMVFSDHAQVAPAHTVPMLTDMNGCCTVEMEKMGYTVLKRDENGNRIGEIDWTKTTAVLQREGHIYLNIKGRNKHTLADGTVIDGIVDPKDQYELEEKIMTDLYSLKSEETGHRIVSVALRNRDAVLLGQGGPEAGDICCWMSEGYNFDHADCLSTTYGEGDTSVSPIFVAAGKGLKSGFETDRIIRQIDFAPTVAALLGVRMPAQCEGAPVYQIFEEEF